ncbi:4-hydroxy-tetrahydrodipicolinate reductase [Thermomicrobium sp. 4228-Ro]|uniref:4-hydroxy-tetrahydrodipicolinate reductase n=1 Tax=Thermomicrobium sp. 4228-Ro TaxID=2993937 RepID=UPI002248BC99|nr:4-hydroxy-tetrahydrodipicolinate reductase [Thermomicrobium sp. 4228-Ro]MCX2726450.1 4-hydroxy-tetrahydrodipicolinate reductase [Thermomicrobium sp. 4228-Ro]
MLRIGVIGITGRMGQAVLDVAAGTHDIAAVAGFVRPGRDTTALRRSLPPSLLLTDALPDLMRLVDVVIDFSHPDLTLAAARAAAASGVPLVTGTTGLAEAHRAALCEAAQHVPIVHAANFSVGIAVLLRLLPELARTLAEWDIEVIERHHRAKRDAPSGTAIRLVQAMSRARAETPLTYVYGRGPGEALRQPGEVGLHAVRAGGEVGRHTVLLASDDEGLEITHWAQSRRAYARGALEAARRIRNRPPGLYSFSELLFS